MPDAGFFAAAFAVDPVTGEETEVGEWEFPGNVGAATSTFWDHSHAFRAFRRTFGAAYGSFIFSSCR